MKFQKITKSREYITKSGIKKTFRLAISAEDAKLLEIENACPCVTAVMIDRELTAKMFPFINPDSQIMLIAPIKSALERNKK